MKLPDNLIVLAIKRLMFFTLPIVLFLYVLYEIVLGYEMENLWRILIPYIVIVTIATISSYTDKKREEELVDVEWLEKLRQNPRWRVLEETGKKLVLKPGFDFPYNMLSKETVSLEYSEERATIQGPRYYVDQLAKDLKGRGSKWIRRFASVGAFIVAIIILSIPVVFESGIYWDLRIRYHNYTMRKVEQIEAINGEELGNTVDNTNNYGNGVESRNHFIYVENHMNLVKTDKDFQLKEYLIQKGGGYGVSRLNISGDWVFYSSGEPYSRMKLDGTKNQTIYKLGYVMEPHLIGDWIYFINFQDNQNVYRMDLNGQNLERFIQKGVSDLAVFDNRLFYSYMDGERGRVESVHMDGSDRRLEFETDSSVRNLSRWNDYWYYMDGDYRLIRTEGQDPDIYQVPVDGNVSAYIITEEGIFYSLQGEDVGYPGEGIYRMDHFGLDKTLLSDAIRVEGFTYLGGWLLFHSSDDLQPPTLKRLDLDSNSIESLE
ncbi:DUF5050 domain-containing protein [Gudongella sp. SC589]|jgi:hypothetical protein|uniref:DUF5050 domain-containing protein n=1 Tax=Gudongella sp. SC589 TaxID=3385990 RepID=UPI003904A068